MFGGLPFQMPYHMEMSCLGSLINHPPHAFTVVAFAAAVIAVDVIVIAATTREDLSRQPPDMIQN